MQWRIQDFPQGGVDLVGGSVDSRGGYISKILYIKMKESGPLGEGGGRAPASRSANVMNNLLSSPSHLEKIRCSRLQIEMDELFFQSTQMNTHYKCCVHKNVWLFLHLVTY